MKNSKEVRIKELKQLMDYEEKNNFPNGDLWRELAEELELLEKVPNIFETLGDILRSPIDYEL
jgi:hypothetical protein